MQDPVRRVAAAIEHTLLKPEATPEQITALCDEAVAHRFAGVCVMPIHVPLAKERLHAEPVQVVTVIGFPLGAHSSMVKSYEARDAVRAGADELDMVLQVGALKAGDRDLVRRDIEEVVKAADGRPVKVILETALLTDAEIEVACRLAEAAGARFVKTSTGFGPGGATVHHVSLMKSIVGDRLGVKASGGIRTAEAALAMLAAGADRLGTSSGTAIIQELQAQG